MKKQLFLTVLILFSMVISLCTVIAYNLASNSLKEQVMFSLNYTDDIMQESGKRLDNSFRNANASIASNNRFNSICKAENLNEVEYAANVMEMFQIYNTTYKSFLLENNFSFCHVSMFIPEKFPIVTEKFDYNKTYYGAFRSEGVYSDRFIKDKDWYNETVKKGQNPCYFESGDGYYCISQMIMNDNTGKAVATSLCVIDLSEMRMYLNNRVAPKSMLYFVDNEGKNIYEETQSLPDYLQNIKLNGKRYVNNSKYIISNVEWLPNFYVINVLEEKKAFVNLRKMQNNIIFSSCLLMLFSILALFFLSNHISKPITDLCRLLSKKELLKPEDIPVNRKSVEMSLLYNSLKIYLRQIRILTDKTIADEKEKKVYELAALEHQINPHFLYNVLNSISAKAMYGQCDNSITDVCSGVAYIMKYNAKDIYSEKPLRRELICIEKYVEIYRNIYEADIELCIDVSEEIQNIVMPKYIIQPLIENSIIHGGDHEQYSININVTARKENNELYIMVTDNGIGCDCEFINSQLCSEKPPSHIMHTGIVNVHKRLELRYGKGYGLKYYKLPVGTKVEIILSVN